eukprot:1146024-Pelagomonas_calceolata.AAC.1
MHPTLQCVHMFTPAVCPHFQLFRLHGSDGRLWPHFAHGPLRQGPGEVALHVEDLNAYHLLMGTFGCGIGLHMDSCNEVQ